MSDYFTPWRVTQDKGWEEGFKHPPPRHEHTDSEYAQVVANWRADKKKFERKADSLIWGVGMEHPDIAVGLRSGKPVIFDDTGIIARIRGANFEGVSSQTMARRIVECVNACEGIKNPAQFIEIVRLLLKSDGSQDFFEILTKAKEFLDDV